jgi:hypothetical protein
MPYSSDDLFRLVQDDHTGEVIDLEKTLATQAIRDDDRAFEDLIRRVLTAWTKAFGGPNQPAVTGEALRRILAAARAGARRLLDGLTDRAPSAIAGGIGPALAMGVRQGAAFVYAAAGHRRRTPAVPSVSRVLRDEAHRIRDLLVERRDRALFLLHPDRVTRWSHMLAGLGAARAALPAIRAHIAWVVNTAVHEGLDAVVRATAPLRLWVSEADACVAASPTPDAPLRPANRSRRPVVGPSPTPGARLQRGRAAEARASCRCRAVPWDDAWTTSGTPFPLALQREAQRSIAYGTARASESRAVRLRAARELLRTVDDLLPAVEARARTAVPAGAFRPGRLNPVPAMGDRPPPPRWRNPMGIHPNTDQPYGISLPPGTVLGYRADGRPIHLIAGGAEDDEPDIDVEVDEEPEPEPEADPEPDDKPKPKPPVKKDDPKPGDDDYTPPSRSEWARAQAALKKANDEAKTQRLRNKELEEKARGDETEHEKALREAREEGEKRFREPIVRKPSWASEAGALADPKRTGSPSRGWGE